MPLGRDRRQRRRRVAAAGAAGAYAVHKHQEHKREGEEPEQQPEAYETEQAPAQEAATEQEAGSPDDSVAQLTQLKSLLDSGALTQEEFDAEKQKIIGA
jgi:Short C-terminal domain